jgi:fatty acid desaturase
MQPHDPFAMVEAALILTVTAVILLVVFATPLFFPFQVAAGILLGVGIHECRRR